MAVTAKLLESKLMPWVYRKAKIVTVSNTSKQDILKLGLSEERLIEVVNPGVDLDQLKPMKKTEYPSMLYLGRLQAYKSVDVAIKAMAMVSKRVPQLKFNIVGYGESKDSWQKLVDVLGLNERVKFLGKVSERVKAELLAKSWIMVQPSRFEGWGITVIEANACGTPVVAADVPGLRDSVHNPQNGILVPWGDVERMADGIYLLMTDKHLRSKLEKSSLDWAQHFSWDQSAERFMRVINQALTPVDNYSQSSKLSFVKQVSDNNQIKKHE